MSTACIAVVILTLCGAHRALSASFDCARAATEREKLVCGDKALSNQDSDLSRDYAAALARVSSQGTAALRLEQRAWLHFIEIACPLPPSTDKDGPAEARWCLSGQYGHRDILLKRDGVQIGAFRFVYRETYRAIPVRSLCAMDFNVPQKGGMEQDVIGYPQVDDVLNAHTTRWNQIEKAAAVKLDASGYVVRLLSFQIELANDSVISGFWSRSYCDGLRSYGWDRLGQTILLKPRPHSLVASDLFRTDRDWRRRLQDVAVVSIKQFRYASVPNFPLATFRSVAVDPVNWVVRKAGLAIMIDPVIFATGSPGEVFLPWSDLRDILVHDPPTF